MKAFVWNRDKNRRLRHERDVTFEEVIFHLERGDLLDTVDHPNQTRYPGQRIYFLRIEDYVYLVPFVESEDEIFLKTIIPSRRATRRYGGRRGQTDD